MGRWCKVLALVEMSEVGRILINRLGAFLRLISYSESHVSSVNRVASRVELLDPLR